MTKEEFKNVIIHGITIMLFLSIFVCIIFYEEVDLSPIAWIMFIISFLYIYNDLKVRKYQYKYFALSLSSLGLIGIILWILFRPKKYEFNDEIKEDFKMMGIEEEKREMIK